MVAFAKVRMTHRAVREFSATVNTRVGELVSREMLRRRVVDRSALATYDHGAIHRTRAKMGSRLSATKHK